MCKIRTRVKTLFQLTGGLLCNEALESPALGPRFWCSRELFSTPGESPSILGWSGISERYWSSFALKSSGPWTHRFVWLDLIDWFLSQEGSIFKILARLIWNACSFSLFVSDLPFTFGTSSLLPSKIFQSLQFWRFHNLVQTSPRFSTCRSPCSVPIFAESRAFSYLWELPNPFYLKCLTWCYYHS